MTLPQVEGCSMAWRTLVAVAISWQAGQCLGSDFGGGLPGASAEAVTPQRW